MWNSKSWICSSEHTVHGADSTWSESSDHFVVRWEVDAVFSNGDLLLFDVTFLMCRKMRGKGKVTIVCLLHKRNCEECWKMGLC